MGNEWVCMFIQTRNMADDGVAYICIFLLITIFVCYIIKVIQEIRSTGSQCSLDEAAYRAFRGKGTVLYTNEGTIYWSKPYEHAEEVFIRKTRNDIWWIDTIWIKNSPCRGCADKLIQHFDSKIDKPTLYIGKIWEGDETANREGLKQMKAIGFRLKVWESKYNKDADSTRRYLENIDYCTMIITFLWNCLRNAIRSVVIMAALLFLIIVVAF